MNHKQNETNMQPLSKKWQIFLSLAAFFIVAFGQPARSLNLSVLSAFCGYAIFWRVLAGYDNPKKRFILSFFWFAAVQSVQLSWMTSHPFYYIYAPYLFLAAFMGCQFGLLGMLVTSNLEIRKILGMAGFWVLMEWIRLFLMSGFSWNPVGMALTGHLYSLQMASVFGIFGLSFFVILTNLTLLTCWMNYKVKNIALFGLFALTPYIFGIIHLDLHQASAAENEEFFTAVLVQPSFAVDEMDTIQDRKKLIYFVMDQLRQILEVTKKHQSKKIDLIVLPEYVVPFGTYTTVFPFENIKEIFVGVFGESVLTKLPMNDDHLVQRFLKDGSEQTLTFVNNAFWLQSLSNIFDAPVIAGLEDVDDMTHLSRNYYSAALYFIPSCANCLIPERYEKRVLVPLGEYIPFTFCQQLAIKYGVTGSFTKGEKAKIFTHPKTPFGVSICYEETFGHVMRENRLGGAKMLVNLTNDGWFPNSTLTKQHFDHARLRSIECGIPLVRACNTGITGGFDSLGRVVAILENSDQQHESLSDSLLINVPTYTYDTLYSKHGDHLILAVSFLSLIGLCRRNIFK